MNTIVHYLKNINNDYNYEMSFQDDVVTQKRYEKNREYGDFHEFNFAERVGNALLTPLAGTVTWIESDAEKLDVKPRPTSIPREILLCSKIALKILLGVTLSSIPAAIGFCIKQAGEYFNEEQMYRVKRKADCAIKKYEANLKEQMDLIDSYKSKIESFKSDFDIGDKSINSIDPLVFTAICEMLGIEQFFKDTVTVAISNQPFENADEYPVILEQIHPEETPAEQYKRFTDARKDSSIPKAYRKMGYRDNPEKSQRYQEQIAEKEPQFREVLQKFSTEWKSYCDCVVSAGERNLSTLLSALGNKVTAIHFLRLNKIYLFPDQAHQTLVIEKLDAAVAKTQILRTSITRNCKVFDTHRVQESV